MKKTTSPAFKMPYALVAELSELYPQTSENIASENFPIVRGIWESEENKNEIIRAISLPNGDMVYSHEFWTVGNGIHANWKKISKAEFLKAINK